MGLEAKGLAYRVMDIHPGLGQIKVFQLSGQKQVPILVNQNQVISDSTFILIYLENIKAKRKLFPDNPKDDA